MKVLLLEPDDDFRRIVGNMLEKSGFKIVGVSSIEEAKNTFQQHIFDLALFSIPVDLTNITSLLSQMRSHPAGATLPIVLMSEAWVESDPRMTHLVRTQDCQSFLTRPFPLLDLADTLRAAQQTRPSAPAADTPSQDTKANHKALALIKEIWLHQKTGVLRVEGSDDWALFVQGCTVDSSATDLARKGIYEGGVEFRETNQSGSSDSGFYQLLWQAVCSNVKTTFLLQREKVWAAPTELYTRIRELPLSEETRDLVGESKESTALSTLLSSDKSQAIELAALESLGIIEFQPIKAPAAPAPKPTPVSPTAPKLKEPSAPRSIPPQSDDTPSTPPIRGGQVASEPAPSGVVLKRLSREWKALANADHFTVLGASPGTDPDLLEQLASRMNQRYSKIAEDPSQPDEVRELAGKILSRVHEAENLIVGRKRAASEPLLSQDQSLTKEDLAFQEGQSAMEGGLYTRAIQCFTAARNERLDSARNLAWLGWAVYQNEDQPIKERCEEALDFLRLASSFDPHHREGQYFLAFIESKHGLGEQALRRLQGLVQDDPQNTLARALLFSLRRELGER